MKSNKVAIMYDFDKTLCTMNMQEYSLLPLLHTTPLEFWSKVSSFSKEENMDPTLAYMYLLLDEAKKNNIKITKEFLFSLGKDIKLYQGVESYFDRINEYGKKLNLEIEHYVISSGTREILKGCSIFDKFTRVYACTYHYNEFGEADWPAVCINYTVKTQFLYRINKNAMDVYDSNTINAHIDAHLKNIPFANMIYIGDGLTDVPCMVIVKNSGGHSIAVYTDENKTASNLVNDERVNYMAKADYSDGGELDTILKRLLDYISMNSKRD